jgi:opacity protein-like surface antigen
MMLKQAKALKMESSPTPTTSGFSRITDNLSLNVEYAYMDMGEAKASKTFLNSAFGNALDTPETKMRSHNLLVGIRYKF